MIFKFLKPHVAICGTICDVSSRRYNDNFFQDTTVETHVIKQNIGQRYDKYIEITFGILYHK